MDSKEFTFGITYDMVKNIETYDPVAEFRHGIKSKDLEIAMEVFWKGLLHNIKGCGESRLALKLALECVYSAGKMEALKGSIPCCLSGGMLQE